MNNTKAILLNRYAWSLSHMLDRPETDIVTQGLRADDFEDTVDILFDDGSTATFHGALVVHDPGERRLVVFTEHCGYHSFPDNCRVTRKVLTDEVMHDGLEDEEEEDSSADAQAEMDRLLPAAQMILEAQFHHSVPDRAFDRLLVNRAFDDLVNGCLGAEFPLRFRVGIERERSRMGEGMMVVSSRPVVKVVHKEEAGA